MELTEFQIEDKLKSNSGLVYYMLEKYHLLNDENAWDDAKDGLYKAILKFDESKGWKFSSFATTVIRNEIFMGLRNRKNAKKRLYTTSLDLELTNSEGDVLTVMDMVADDSISNQDPERLEHLKKIKQVTRKEFKKLVGKAREIMEVWLEHNGDISQRELAEKTGHTQGYISRVLAKFKANVRKYV